MARIVRAARTARPFGEGRAPARPHKISRRPTSMESRHLGGYWDNGRLARCERTYWDNGRLARCTRHRWDNGHLARCERTYWDNGRLARCTRPSSHLTNLSERTHSKTLSLYSSTRNRLRPQAPSANQSRANQGVTNYGNYKEHPPVGRRLRACRWFSYCFINPVWIDWLGHYEIAW